MDYDYKWAITLLLKYDTKEDLSNQVFTYIQRLIAGLVSEAAQSSLCVNIILLCDASGRQLFKAHHAAALQGTPTLYVLRYSTKLADDAFWYNKLWVVFQDVEERFEVLQTAPATEAIDSPGLTGLLKRALRDITYQSNMVVAWDHGNSFSIFKMHPPAPPSGMLGESLSSQVEAALNNPINNNWQLFVPKASPVSPPPPLGVAATVRLFNAADAPMASTTDEGPIFFDLAPQKPLALTMDELGDALRQLEKKVNVLVLANCFMCSADTLYGLRDAVEILVAAETAIPFNIFDYAQVMKARGTGQATAAEVAQRLVAQVKMSTEHWYHEGVDKGLISERIAVFALDMSHSNTDYWNELDQLCQALTQQIRQHPGAAKALVSHMDALTNLPGLIASADISLHLLDARRFFERAAYLFRTPAIYAAYTSFSATHTWMRRIADDYFIGARAADTAYACSGLSLFFPRSRTQFNCAYIRYYYNGAQQNPYRSAFAKKYGWDEFLHALFLGLPV
ncbi:MAG: hypothetical protein EAY75_16590 [Bacteroidetes bacterium]|nr:MAG: hypothetical protein EAY75_16590 [Bacteroidota bacterium]